MKPNYTPSDLKDLACCVTAHVRHTRETIPIGNRAC